MFFFRQSKMNLMEKKHYTMYRSVYRFVEFLIWKVGFHRWLLFFLNSHTCKHWVDIYSKLQNPENKVISIKHLMAEKLQRNIHNRTFSEEVKAYRLRSIFFLLLFITFDRAQLVARLTCGHSAYIITKKQHVNECQMQVTFKSFIFIV